VCDHLFVFQGEGEIKDFPGNYSDYHLSAKKEEKNKAKVDKKEKPAVKTPVKDKPKKLTFKEKFELEGLEKDLAELEAQKESLQNDLNSGQLATDELVKKSKILSDTMEQIEMKELRWLELKEIEEI
jgi:ATP-binding cassette subfamily F protein uup